MVDEGQIAMRPAVELSYLPKEQQEILYHTMQSEDCTPSHIQAMKMRRFSKEEKLDGDVIFSIITEKKTNQVEQFRIPRKRIDRYFPQGMPKEKIEDIIVKALECRFNGKPLL